MSTRILIIGSDKDCCLNIKEFFVTKGLITTTVLDYNEGLEKLLFEKPHITVIEYISQAISATFLSKINNSDSFQLVENDNYDVNKDLCPVFLFQDKENLELLFNNIKKALSEIDFENHNPVTHYEEGILDEIFFPRLLKKIQSDQSTGTLIINSNFEIKIYFQNGIPTFAEGGNVETGLARILLNDKKINIDDYNQLINEITESDNNQKIGEIIVSKGLISPHELNTYLQLQVKEKIIRGFLFTKGSYRFEYSEKVPSKIYQSKFSLDDIILEGMNRYLDVSELHSKSMKVQILQGFSQKINKLGLGPKEVRVAQLIKNRSSIETIYEKARLSKDQIIKLLFFLAFYEVLEIKGVSVDEIGISSCRKVSEKLNLISEDDLLILDESNIFEEENTDEINDSLTIETIEIQDENINEVILENNTSENVTNEITSEIIEENPEEGQEESDLPDFSKMDDENQHEKEDHEFKILDESGMNYPREDEDKEYLDYIEKEGVEIEGNDKKSEEEIKTKDTTEIENFIREFHSSIEDENDFYKILKVENEADSQEIRMSYLEMVKKFHPDISAKYSPEIKELAEEIFSKLTTAYETLSDESLRDVYDSRSELDELKGKAGDIYEAEVNYIEGEAFLRQRDYQKAEAKLKKALELNSNESAYLGAYTWARYCGSENKDVIFNEIKIKLEAAISMEPDLAQNYYYLGSVYKSNDNLFKAKQNFEKAVELDSNFIDAKRELRLMVSRKVESRTQKTGKINNKNIEKRFWSGLFKK